MIGSKPYGPSDRRRLPPPRPERRVGPACSALPSPRPSPAGPAGRGRNLRRAVKDQARVMIRNGFDCCSLSHRERVRVRGETSNSLSPAAEPEVSQDHYDGVVERRAGPLLHYSIPPSLHHSIALNPSYFFNCGGVGENSL